MTLTVSLVQQSPIPLACTFSCATGELVALVGPSGSGKTTVLRCIAGLDRSARGEIRCNDVVWQDDARCLPPQQRRAGMVFQSYALLPHLSALRNVMLALGHLPPPQREAAAKNWLARAHLSGLEERRPGALSGGQQQRVALARALARASADNAPGGVLLLDEPFSAVDQMTRAKLRAELARLRCELNIPIVLVTHDLDEARQLADTLVVLHRGKSLQHGAPDEVLLRPHSSAIARLVGQTNLFAGTIEMQDGKACLTWANRRLAIASALRPSGNFYSSNNFEPGSTVSWMIPPEGVLLHRADRPTQGDAENPVHGTVTEALRLGSFTQITLAISGAAQPLVFPVSSHTVERLGLRPGSAASVTLLAQRIHLMPAD